MGVVSQTLLLWLSLGFFCSRVFAEESFFYDRTVCTGLGDRIGALMTLATLSRLYHKTIYFKWCEDPSAIFASQRRYMPRWYGYDYNLTEFNERFWGFRGVVLLNKSEADSFKTLNPHVKHVDYFHGEVSANEGLDHIYTTSFRTTKLFQHQADGPMFIQSYRWVASKLLLYTVLKNQDIIMKNGRGKYIVLHMRGFDDNAYTPFETCHDEPRLYCTGQVIKKMVRHFRKLNMQLPTVYAISNNVSWAMPLVKHSKIHFVTNTSEYDDFALLLGATAIIQHANRGWSSYSNNPAMMSRTPLLTTFKETNQNHRYAFFKEHGPLPVEFYGCSNVDLFLDELVLQLEKD